ncbi:hypothetical protein BC830DRAFT_1106065 [Chytriomyces sp. MP71]|nr:hypothetical protein BC830DRAFT_1106065 [Chytriomyces sp. MP71]
MSSKPGGRTPKAAKTVASLHPAAAITVIETARVSQAAQLMASKRADAVLVVNSDGQLNGIMSDRDIVNRVLAEGRDPRATLVRDVMTRDPLAVYETGLRNEALGIMVQRRFRHLPVISTSDARQRDDDDDDDDDDDEEEEDDDDEEDPSTNIVGLLDITKLVFDKLDDLDRKVNASSATDRCPDLAAVLRARGPAPLVPVDAPVRDVARIMRDGHETGVLLVAVSEISGADHTLAGIATTKDLVTRVVATGLDPATTPISQIMTPNPKSASPSTSILDALKTLHTGRYLHLPVVDGSAPIGLVDVLTLTMSMLDYLIKKENHGEATFTTAEASGPLWNNFWNSTWSSVDTESNAGSEALSDDHGSHYRYSLDPARASALSNQSYYTAPAATNPSARNSYMTTGNRQSIPAQLRGPLSSNGEIPPYSGGGVIPPSMLMEPTLHRTMMGGGPGAAVGLSSPGTSVYNDETNSLSGASASGNRVQIKLTDPARGKLVRFSVVLGTTLADLRAIVSGRLGCADGGASLRLSYEDDDGDWVLLSVDADLEEAVNMARRLGEKLCLRVGDAPAASAYAVGAPPATADTGAGAKDAVSPTSSVPPASKGVVEFLQEAPLSVNVALSAGIVVVAAFVVSRLYNQNHF